MFDLVGKLQSKSLEETVQKETITSVLFHQTQECVDLVDEAFRFENINAPSMLSNRDAAIQQHVRESRVEIVIVELNLSQNVTKDMERISHLLPNSASVIVIGSEDAISTIRNLKEMGFYYVFWPITKQELIDFVRNVNSNRQRNSGLGKDRTAKRVGIWGTKGGVGATMLTAEIAFELSNLQKSSSLIIDHDFRGGNLDIFLGIKQFEKKHISRASLASSIDATYASGLVKKVNDMLAFISLESNELNELELKDYIRTLADQLAGQYNFILEDLSRANNSKQDLDYIANAYDVVVLLVEPTVSSVREAKRTLRALEIANSDARYLVVLNYTVSEKAASVSESEVKQFLGRDVDIVFPNEPRLNKLILDDKHIYQHDYPVSQSLHCLTSALLGQPENSDKVSWIHRLLKRGN
ncbi:chromosome partitioning protein ParA [Vibrio aquaticus]|uniref:Chromosome partitioning protein ParA n=1 Tax=Vibrio aquaticus TaxID=2496559 RepID=A0A3S0QD11_9VIBR|nr:cellulose synthase operon protein YhjQ/BcsQ [Vibrio aquaticus]RTZ15591.1 chromosome partitioning protein ParA [Vibrio aquaticus]